MNKILLIVIYLAFISLGLPDGVFGVAWPSMRREFAIPLQAAGMVGIILMFCSSISSFASGTILRRFGTGRVVLISGLMTGFALLGYAMTPSFFWLVIAALPLGFGQGAVDSGLNHYVANNYSSRHMNWLHCFWGVSGRHLGTADYDADLSRQPLLAVWLCLYCDYPIDPGPHLPHQPKVMEERSDNR